MKLDTGTENKALGKRRDGGAFSLRPQEPAIGEIVIFAGNFDCVGTAVARPRRVLRCARNTRVRRVAVVDRLRVLKRLGGSCRDIGVRVCLFSNVRQPVRHINEQMKQITYF